MRRGFEVNWLWGGRGAVAAAVACGVFVSPGPVVGQVDSSPFGFFFDGSDDETDFSREGAAVELDLPDDGPGAGVGPAEGDGYQEPNFSVSLFDVEKVGMAADGREALARLLLAAAVNFPRDASVTDLVQEKAIALAKRLDPTEPEIFKANSLLKRGLKPGPVAGGDVVKKRAVADEIWKVAVKRLDGKTSDEQMLGAYLVDVSASLDPDDPFKLERRGRLQKAGVRLAWGRVVGAGASGAAGDGEAVVVDGGPALKRREAEVGVLYLKVKADQTTEGGLGSVKLTAGETPGGGALTLAVAGGTPSLRESAPVAVARLAKARANWPDGVKLTARLGSWYRAHERDSAAVACAVAADSVMRDWDVDPGVALVGGVDAAGTVTRVRELANRLENAAALGVKVVGVPNNDDGETADLCILGRLQPLIDVQVIGLETVDDAVALAPKERAPDLAKALELFTELQTALAGRDIEKMVGVASVQARLREIGQLAPNHVSAKYLLLAGLNRPPSKLSFQGSRDALTAVAVPLGRAAGYGVEAETVLLKTPSDIATECLFRLQNLRPKLDEATLDYADTLSEYGEAFKEYSKTTNPSSARARTLRMEMNEALRKLEKAAERFRQIDRARFGP